MWKLMEIGPRSGQTGDAASGNHTSFAGSGFCFDFTKINRLPLPVGGNRRRIYSMGLSPQGIVMDFLADGNFIHSSSELFFSA
jgi:hypothetical protein